MVQKYEVESIKVINGESKTGDVKRNYSDITKAKEKLGWVPAISQDECLKYTAEYFVK